MINTYLPYALFDSHEVRSSLGVIRLKRSECGYLPLPTGRIVAGDAMFLCDQKPFDYKAPPGRCKVVASHIYSDNSPDKIAFISLCFADSQPVAWRLAEPKGFRGDNAIAAIGDVASVKTWDECVEHEGEQHAWKRLKDLIATNNECPISVLSLSQTEGEGLVVWENDTDCFGRAYYGICDKNKIITLTIDTGLMDRLLR